MIYVSEPYIYVHVCVFVYYSRIGLQPASKLALVFFFF